MTELAPTEYGTPAGAIVVVDDDPLLLSLMVDMIGELGLPCHGFKSADDALMFVMRHESTIGLVFTDMVMPGQIAGDELALMLHRRYPDLPVIVTSGFGDEASRFGTGITFVPKPWALEAMSALILKLVRHPRGT